jgi:hypothetical protein
MQIWYSTLYLFPFEIAFCRYQSLIGQQ